jgi:hypothetical protein
VNDPDIQKALQPDLLRDTTLKIMTEAKYELNSPGPKKDETDPDITWKQKGEQFVNKLMTQDKSNFLQYLKITEDDCDLWFNFYKSESTEIFVKENSKQLESFVLKIVHNIEEAYNKIKQNQLNLQCYPGCSNRMMSRIEHESEVQLSIIMISIIFIERELEKMGISCNFDDLKPKELECAIA